MGQMEQNLPSVVAFCGATGWVCDLLAAQHGTGAVGAVGLKRPCVV